VPVPELANQADTGRPARERGVDHLGVREIFAIERVRPTATRRAVESQRGLEPPASAGQSDLVAGVNAEPPQTRDRKVPHRQVLAQHDRGGGSRPEVRLAAVAPLADRRLVELEPPGQPVVDVAGREARRRRPFAAGDLVGQIEAPMAQRRSGSANVGPASLRGLLHRLRGTPEHPSSALGQPAPRRRQLEVERDARTPVPVVAAQTLGRRELRRAVDQVADIGRQRLLVTFDHQPDERGVERANQVRERAAPPARRRIGGDVAAIRHLVTVAGSEKRERLPAGARRRAQQAQPPATVPRVAADMDLGGAIASPGEQVRGRESRHRDDPAERIAAVHRRSRAAQDLHRPQ